MYFLTLGSALKIVKLSEKHYKSNTGEYHLEKIVHILHWSFSFKMESASVIQSRKQFL